MWKEPFLFKYYPNQIIRRCIQKEKTKNMLNMSYGDACGGHFTCKKTTKKVLD